MAISDNIQTAKVCEQIIPWLVNRTYAHYNMAAIILVICLSLVSLAFGDSLEDTINAMKTEIRELKYEIQQLK